MQDVYDFFDQDAQELAKSLLGKILCAKYGQQWLYARIIETEAYYLNEKASHASLGFTEKRKALFMEAGTIYMYYARGGDSLNISAHGAGNAVLIKSAYPYVEAGDAGASAKMITTMQQLNPKPDQTLRRVEELCAGQTLLCRSLGLRVRAWDQKVFDEEQFCVRDVGYRVKRIIQTRRLGIPIGRDEHLLYRFIDYDYAAFCTQNPLTRRSFVLGEDYLLLDY